MTPQKKIRVFMVEDSAVARAMLVHVLRSDPELEVVGCAADGEEAMQKLGALDEAQWPHVITMDIHMPKMDGFETTRRIMETHPVPIVVVSASARPDDTEQAFRVMDAGAVSILEKPPGIGHRDHAETCAKLIRTVKLMSEIRVVKRWRRPRAEKISSAPGATTEFNGALNSEVSSLAAIKPAAASRIELVAIGASTGGPPVLGTILGAMRKNFRVPILIVQHIAPGFVGGLVEWLAHTTGQQVHLAEHGMRPASGHVYVAPDDKHLTVENSGRIFLSDAPTENGLRPAVSVLFRSVAKNFGSHAAGVLLTGMGRDGADELKTMRERGAITFAQDRESSIIFGMPGEAVKLGAATHVLPPLAIAAALDTLLNSAENDSAKQS